ncbi:Rep family protein [Enterococcus casseliflavus]|uniref:Rep family protein n=1 Tax=Enterococcus casseliflavus TaxID=37734 RepID=UPI0039A61590
MKKQANLSCVMLVQQLEPEFWIGWDDVIIEEAHNGNIRPLIEELVKRFEKDGCEVNEAYGILHDKDLISVWNQDEMKNVEELKTKHIHILIKFGKGDTLNSLAVKAGVSLQYLEKAKSGRYGYDNLLAYLIHVKDENKYQYNPSEVVTVSGEDYISVYNRRMETWVRGRATKEAKATDLSVDYLVSEILAGKLTKSQVLLTNEFYRVYALHKRKINDAFDTAGENKSYQTIADLDAGNFKKTILFIMAESGAGKTVLSKKIISILQSVALTKTEQRWDYCLTASNNAFDEYNGQDILFLDDVRGDSLSVSDWLKLLDPFTISPISARYHNRMGSAKVIIITSTKTPSDFFSIAKGNFHEDLGQFFRRVDLLINIDGDNFHLSKPEKASTALTQLPYVMKPPSHYFRIDGTYHKNKALDKVTKTVIQNMQWNKKKPVTQPAEANVTNHLKK